MITGFTNGCFDLLHEGHRHFLAECRKQCDKLIVAVNSDDFARVLKGDERPRERLALRRNNLLAFAEETHAIYNEMHLLELIKDKKPDILFKGRDYEGKPVTGATHVQGYGGKLVLIPLLDGYSTTRILIEANACSEANACI